MAPPERGRGSEADMVGFEVFVMIIIFFSCETFSETVLCDVFAFPESQSTGIAKAIISHREPL